MPTLQDLVRAEPQRRMTTLEKLGQTWPVRMGRSVLSAMALPGDVYAGRTQPGTDDYYDRATELAGTVTGGSFAAAPAVKGGVGMGIKAYHGSPHDFDKFSMSKIGTGEGAQAYGHGLYFAEKEGVAKSYRDALGSNLGNLSDVLPNYYKPGNIVSGYWGKDKVLKFEHGSGLGDFRVQVQQVNANGDLVGRPRWHSTMPEPKEVEKVLGKTPGRMYEVDIDAKPEQFLDWDKPLSQQALPDDPRLAQAAGVAKQTYAEPTGGDLYRSMYQNQGMTTDVLRERGIPGIKYLDQGSRGAGDGSRNYVLFRDDIVKIIRKYGIAGAAAMTGMSQADMRQAMASEQTQSEDLGSILNRALAGAP